MVRIADDEIIGPVPRIITDHLLPLLPQQAGSDQHVQRIIDPPFDVVLILPLVVAALVHDDLVDQPIRHLLVLGDGKLRDYLVHRFREVFEALGVLGAAVGTAPLVALRTGHGLKLIDLLEVIF